MRIAFFNYSDSASGAEALIQQTIERLISRGVDAKLFVFDRFTDHSHVHTLPHFWGERRLEYLFRRTFSRNNILFPSTFFLARNRWINEADIWHFHNLHGHFVSIPLLARHSLKRPIVLSPVDEFLATGYCTYTQGCNRFRDACGQCPQLDLPYPGISRDTTSALLAMKKSAVEKSEFNILVHTQYLADFYASTFVKARRIEQIYYGVDTCTFRPMPAEEVAADIGLRITPDCFTIGLVHSDIDDKRKGILQLIPWLQSLKSRTNRNVRLLVVGRASERAKQFETAELEVVTLPFSSNQQILAKALNLCDVLMYPTRADNLSLTCLAALACGVPVISSDVGGQAEAIKENVNGFLCDFNRPEQFTEHLELLMTDRDLTKRMGAEARRIVLERFQIDRYIDGLIAYYARVMRQ